MVKSSTRTLQTQLLQLGKELGFNVREEYSFQKTQDMYTPRYDLVWLLDVTRLNVHAISAIPLIENQYVPFAAFEIEGSTTSSKNQMGNIGNLELSPCFYNFLVVNNAAAAKENDTYRRAMKIVRTMHRMIGERPLFLFDASMLENLPPFIETSVSVCTEQKNRLKGSGGEKGSIDVSKKLMKELVKSKLEIEYDHTPDYFKWAFHIDKKIKSHDSMQYTFNPVTFEQRELKLDTQYYYKPKIDITAGFHLSGGFVDFLRVMALRLKSDAIHFPLLQYVMDKKLEELYYPLLGIEIEMKESKHAIGSLMNLTNYHQYGWLVASVKMGPYFETYKYHFGLQNVTYMRIGEL